MKDCPLCKREHKTTWKYEDSICWVARCETDGQWMIVLKRHTMEPTNIEIVHMEMVAKELFGENVKFRKKQGHPEYNHFHWHILEVV